MTPTILRATRHGVSPILPQLCVIAVVVRKPEAIAGEFRKKMQVRSLGT